ncbi:type VII secretion integral membrane protein EccD [Actinomadura vinacea]|uniref:type VII secretion integral membrane protein EccD n=1 Tax=Actinomadura vinacea TaxID=115336 RepID=UPI0031D8540C
MTIVAPRRRVDLSMPADVPLSYMLPTLLRAAGERLGDAGLAHSGWVLQRLDDPPFDPARDLTALGVRDGELLYLRPRSARLPELAFDDVADVVASGIRERPDRWRPTTTRSFGLGVVGAALLAGAVVIVLSGPSWNVPAIAAGVIALVTVIAAGALSRALGDAGAGAVLGYAAMPYAFLAGLLAPARSTLELNALGSPHMLAGFGVLAFTAVVAAFLVVDGLPVFLGAAIAALFGAVGSAVVFFAPSLEPAGIAAVAAVIAMAFSAAIPSFAFRLARVPLPRIPANAADLRNDTASVDGRGVLARTDAADRYATGLISCVAMIALGALAFLFSAGGWAGAATTGALSLSLLLRSRVFRSIAQRAWLMVTGLIGLGLLAVGTALSHGQAVSLAAALVPLLLTGGIVTGLVMWLPDHRPTPFWGRAGDILDVIIVVSLIPLALAVLDVYARVRGLAG